jgi:hypothetical protein
MRSEVLSAITTLADLDHQERVWVGGDIQPGIVDNLDYVVHTLYDDVNVYPDPASTVGIVLHPDEVEPLLALDAVFGPLIKEIGDEPDAAYLAHPKWPSVVAAAAAVHAVMQAHEK